MSNLVKTAIEVGVVSSPGQPRAVRMSDVYLDRVTRAEWAVYGRSYDVSPDGVTDRSSNGFTVWSLIKMSLGDSIEDTHRTATTSELLDETKYRFMYNNEDVLAD